MKADGLWEQGYTGDGTVIAVLDSGLNTSHEAFADGSLMESPALGREDVAEFSRKGGSKGRYVSQRIPFPATPGSFSRAASARGSASTAAPWNRDS